MSTDFIPSNDADFNNFLNVLATYAGGNYGVLGLTADQGAALRTAMTDWDTAYTAWEHEQTVYRSVLAAKDAARDAATALVRQANAIAQALPGITDATLASAGLPIHKTTRTPAPDLETHPVLYRVDNDHLLQRLWFSDSATPGSKARPNGAAACEIRQALVAPGGAAPTDPDAMPFLAIDTKSPHRTDFSAPDVGKMAYYAQRWTNTRGVPGPWSVVSSYPVG